MEKIKQRIFVLCFIINDLMDDILKKFFLGVLCEHEYSC